MLKRERILTLLGAASIFILLAACSSDPAVLSEKAMNFAGEGEIEKAMELFDKALEQNLGRAGWMKGTMIWLQRISKRS